MGIVLFLLGVALAACVFVMYVIAFRLRSHLISLSYRFIFGAKVCFTLMCASGIYLVIWPLPSKYQMRITLVWFAVLAIGCILSATGFYLYSRDVNSVLASDDYPHPLPAVPPTLVEQAKQQEV